MSHVTDSDKKKLILNYCVLRMGQISRGDVYEVATRCGYLTANCYLSDSWQSLSQVLAATDRIMKVAS